MTAIDQLLSPRNHRIHAIRRLLEEGDRISLADLARREGRSGTCTWRWATRGCRGVLLESFVLGGVRFTTEPAYERFLQALLDACGGAEKCDTADDQQLAEEG